jgi:hypothetical protein
MRGDEPELFDVPLGYKLLVFGEFSFSDSDHNFVFLAPEEFRVEPGMTIPGAKYAERIADEGRFEIMEYVNVYAEPISVGEYYFKVSSINCTYVCEFNIGKNGQNFFNGVNLIKVYDVLVNDQV